MSTSRNNGGGFFKGAAYGAIVSLVLFFVLAFLFPMPPQATPAPEAAPSVAMAANQAPKAADTAPPTVALVPVAQPDVAAMQATPPQASDSSGVSLGAGMKAPASNAPVAPALASQSGGGTAPGVETQSTGLPDIGAGTPATQAPAAEGGAATGAKAEAVPAAPAPAPAVLAHAASGPASEVFAVAFTGDPNKPRLAIILEDTLETSLAPLFDTGAPLSFAVPAGADASASAQSIRQSGYEVVAMVPDGTSRTDHVATSISGFMKNVPVAVALLDSKASPLLLNRDSMQAVLDTTGPAGLGLIVFSGVGDVLARDQALKAGSPFGIVASVIDDSNNRDSIVQALDQAAFTALTKGSAIVFARTKPTTIDAIVAWLGGAYAKRLQIVPVSAAIQRPNN